MKMFLTRLGFASKMVVTGDITQIDLANPKHSGLIHAIKVLENENKISFCHFETKDVVRHQIIKASLSVRPRIKASGATSMMFLLSSFSTLSKPNISYKAS
jgi:phosphate starvation-inducible protein PhoH